MIIRSLRAVGDGIGAFFLGGFEIIRFYIRQHLFGNSLPNYIKVTNFGLYRGGQPSIRGLKKLKEEGIKVVVNLRARNRDEKTILKCVEGKMNSIHLPTIPFRPSEPSVVAFLKLFVANKNVKVYVHCFHGADRTGLMCAMYRIVLQGWDKSSAIAEMRKNGFHYWHRSILTFIEDSNVEELRRKVLRGSFYANSDELLPAFQS